MRPVPLIVASALLFVPRLAGATEPDTGLGVFTAAALDAAGFIVGGTLMATSAAGGSGDGQRSFGWLAIQAGFTLSPLAAHGVVGEWDRGAAFAAIPAASVAGTAVYYRAKTNAVEYGTLVENWFVWGLFTAGFAVSTAGAIDVIFAANRQRERGMALRPMFGPGRAGLLVEGTL
jgi:hypothetical protein